MAAEMANVEEAMERLTELFQTRTGRGFVLAPGFREEPEYLPSDYDSNTVESLWQLQPKFTPEPVAEPGLRRYLNPPVRHVLPQFSDLEGAQSCELVDDANLRHLLKCSKQADVEAAFDELATITVNTGVVITRKEPIHTSTSEFGSVISDCFHKFTAFEKFGDLKLGGTGRCESTDYPRRDSVLHGQHHPPRSLVETNELFSVQFRSADQQDVGDYDSFGLLTLELTEIQKGVITGLHLSGYHRSGTDDAIRAQAIQNEYDEDNHHRLETIRKNFQTTATQAFQEGVMNKCELVCIMDPAGMCLMLLNENEIEGLNEALEAIRLNPHDKNLSITVNYDKEYCVHWEDGTFWKDLMCAIVSQLYAQFPQFKEFMEQYRDVELGIEAPEALDRYKNVRRDIISHTRSHNLYEQCTEYFSITVATRARDTLQSFGNFVERDFGEYQILEILQDTRINTATSLYKVSHSAVNQGKPFVTKLCKFVDEGEPMFLNELEAYQHLMCQDADPRLWPLLLEFGLVFVDGMPHYYLGIEYLDGEYANSKDRKMCRSELRLNYGVVHGDVDRQNFVRV